MDPRHFAGMLESLDKAIASEWLSGLEGKGSEPSLQLGFRLVVVIIHCKDGFLRHSF